MVRALVLSDTHIRDPQQLPPAIADALAQADWVIHCGDFTAREVLDELRRRCRNFAGVYGNTDGRRIREVLPEKLTLEIEGKHLAIIHPAWGGPPWGLEEELLEMFRCADAILFGHTHEPHHRQHNHTLLFNPGQGYPSLGIQATYGLLTITPEGIEAEIKQA